MKLSVIVPVYNEAGTIIETLKAVMAAKPENKEIIVVDDASTDGTYEQLKEISGIKLIRHEKNQGKGAAIRTALKHITGDIVIIQDGDLEYDPEEYIKLITPILKGKTSIVYGSRFTEGNVFQKAFYYANKFLTLLTNFLYNAKISDMETCYKCFKREIIKGIPLVSKRFEIEPELTAKFRRAGYKIYEVPIRYAGRKRSEGKKIGLKDGIKAIITLLKYKLK